MSHPPSLASTPVPRGRPPVLRPALFCDRDGVLMEEVGYVRDPALVRLIPGVAETVRRFNDAGIPVVSVSNQSGVARGLMTMGDVMAVQERLAELLLQEAGAVLAAMYFAPHHPEGLVAEFTGHHEDRKPSPGMLRKAAQRLQIDLARSWIVGDRLTDLEAGRNAGLAGAVLVRTGYGVTAEREGLEAQAGGGGGGRAGAAAPWDLVVDSLPAAAGELFARLTGKDIL
ncbi:MAG: D-glycero-alpha-D-manno-heptose-1,7-bisphosphate 7-phosphatase, partial [Planctomycetota bacterium]